MPNCNSCGGHVTKQFVRVFGNNEDEVYGCGNCMATVDLINGDGTERGREDEANAGDGVTVSAPQSMAVQQSDFGRN